MKGVRFTPRNRAHWRRWLQNNHSQKNEIWLVFLKKHTPKPNLSYSDAVEEALCYGWIDGIKRSIDADRYMHRFSPRKSVSNWSKSNKQRVQRLLDAGLMRAAGKRTVTIAKQNGKWDESVTAPDRIPMPSELDARLQSSAQAATFFDGLAPSRQQQFIAWVATAKRPETRLRRAYEAAELLERGETLGMR